MNINKDYLVTDNRKHGGKRKKPVRVLIPHHNAGVTTGLNLARYMKNTDRQLSANYVIGSDGIFQTLDESLEPYTTSNRAIDTEAITFEIANSTGAPEWRISNESFNALVELSIDICKRYGIKEVSYTGDKRGNIHLHKWYDTTNCPGPYVESLMPLYAQRVNEGLKPKPVPQPKPTGGVTMRKVNVKVRLLRDTNLWAFDADKWSDIKPVKAFKKGEILEIAGVAKNALGGVYYLTPYSYEKKIANGFNKVDCEIIEI